MVVRRRGASAANAINAHGAGRQDAASAQHLFRAPRARSPTKDETHEFKKKSLLRFVSPARGTSTSPAPGHPLVNLVLEFRRSHAGAPLSKRREACPLHADGLYCAPSRVPWKYAEVKRKTKEIYIATWDDSLYFTFKSGYARVCVFFPLKVSFLAMSVFLCAAATNTTSPSDQGILQKEILTNRRRNSVQKQVTRKCFRNIKV